MKKVEFSVISEMRAAMEIVANRNRTEQYPPLPGSAAGKAVRWDRSKRYAKTAEPLVCRRINHYIWTQMSRLRNTRHERFAREVAALSPLATAYREAGFGGDPRWHPFNASKLANKPRVRARIDQLRLEFEKMSAIHVDYVRHQLLRIVEADPKDLYERDPDDPLGKKHRLRPISELPAHVAKAISRVRIDPDTGLPVDIQFASKCEASATLLRSLPGGAIERRELTGKDGTPFELFDPANLGKLADDDLDALKRIAEKIAGADASEPG